MTILNKSGLIKQILTVVLISFVLVGCARDPNHNQTIIESSTQALEPSNEKLSGFSDFDLLPLSIPEEVSSHKKKAIYADRLQNELTLKVGTLFEQWQNSSTDSQRKLNLQPELVKLKIISSGSRVMWGAFVGNSNVVLKLILTDAATGNIVAQPVINSENDGISGAWSYGSTDRNLVRYVAEISAQYLKDNY